MSGGYDVEPFRDAAARSYDVDCTGHARVMGEVLEGQSCLRWKLLQVACKGDRFVDWVHRDAPDATICLTEGSWRMTTDLPGRAQCWGKVKKGAQARFPPPLK